MDGAVEGKAAPECLATRSRPAHSRGLDRLPGMEPAVLTSNSREWTTHSGNAIEDSLSSGTLTHEDVDGAVEGAAEPGLAAGPVAHHRVPHCAGGTTQKM